MSKSPWVWSNYKGNLEWLEKGTIFLTRHGSHAYGTNIETSDEDWRGVAIPPKKYLLGTLNRFEQAECKEPDTTIFDLRKFVSLAAQANPNVIEILFTEPSDHAIVNRIGDELIDRRDWFVTKRCRHTFSGYALSQLSRMKLHRKYLLNPPKSKPTRADFGLPESTLIPNDQLVAITAEIQKKIDSWSLSMLDGIEDANRVALVNKFSEHLAEIGVAQNSELWLPAARSLGASDNLIEAMKRERAYTTAKRDFDKYQEWKRNRNEARAELEAKFSVDTKHAMHLIRLLRMCREMLTGQGVIVRRPDAEELKSIRAGAWGAEKIIDWAENEDKELQKVAEESTLPRAPDIEKIDTWLVNVIESTL